MIRDEKQNEVVDLYIELNMLKCCGILSTGFGKSKVVIDILKRLNPEKVLILVNSTLLRDTNWEAEFVKWREEELFSRVELSTYQTAYKWTKDTKNLDGVFVVADEVDFAADTDELSKFFYEYSSVRVLGLTGFITASKRAWFEEYLPVFTELTADMAQELKILNNLHFVFVKYDLSNNSSDITVEYKKHGEVRKFTQSENNAYDYANKKAQYQITLDQKAQNEYMAGEITKAEYDSKIKSNQYHIRKAVAARNDVLLHSKTTATMAKKLIAHITSTQPDSKIIVFSKRTAQSVKVCGEDNIYNGTISKKKAQQNYDDFNQGVKRVLGVCDKVNRGANIEGLDTGMLETYFGSDTKAAQRLGRLMRLKPNQIATVYILLPYYMRKEVNNTYTLQETQQVKWARKMLSSTKIKSSVIWNYCVVKPKTDE